MYHFKKYKIKNKKLRNQPTKIIGTYIKQIQHLNCTRHIKIMSLALSLR